MDAKLVVVGGNPHVRQYELHLPTVIGRSRRTDLTLGHPLVSRKHCEVFEADGMLMVRDLGSLNGTFVGETRIAEEAMPVMPGELLSVGPVTFLAVYGAVPLGDSAMPWDASGPTLDAPLPGRPDEIGDTPARRKRGLAGGNDDRPPSRT